MSDDDYPTDEELAKIKDWQSQNGFRDLFDYVESLWWMADWGFQRTPKRYYLSTGGWSGNEDIIRAMKENFIFWSQCWLSSRTGGHHRFKPTRRHRKEAH